MHEITCLGVRMRKNYSQFSRDVTNIQTKSYLFFWVFTFMTYYSSQTPLSSHIFGLKGFVFLEYRVLEFPNFCLTWHLVGSQESSHVTVGYKRYRSFRFCYPLNIPCHRINITWIFMSSSRGMNLCFCTKPQRQMFLLVSGCHICAPQRDNNMVPPYKPL